MDPISALSLVANIFAVITFAGDVVQLAAQIHETGTSERLDSLEQLATGLHSAVAELTSNESNPNPDSHEDALSTLGHHTTEMPLSCQL